MFLWMLSALSSSFFSRMKFASKIIYLFLPFYMVEVAIASVDVYLIMMKRNWWHCTGLKIWILLLSQVQKICYFYHWMSTANVQHVHSGLWGTWCGIWKKRYTPCIYIQGYIAQCGGLYPLYHTVYAAISRLKIRGTNFNIWLKFSYYSRNYHLRLMFEKSSQLLWVPRKF